MAVLTTCEAKCETVRVGPSAALRNHQHAKAARG